MEHAVIPHEKHHLPAASRQPDNAYYLRGCENVNRSPSYASCLYKLEEHEAGRVNTQHADCVEAFRRGTCDAQNMRQQEQLAGVALYYFPRNPPQALLLPHSVTGDFGVQITNLTPPDQVPKDRSAKVTSRFTDTVKKPLSILDAIDQATYADVLNAPVAAPAPAKKAVTTADLAKFAQPGESMIDTAKRLLNKTKETA